VIQVFRGSLALLVPVLVTAACGSSPANLTCPTVAQSITFRAAGSCSGGLGIGTVTISTQPGLCSLLVKGGPTAGLPEQGQFFGTAAETGYDLRKGNWYLFVSEGDTEDGSIEIICEESLESTTGEISLACSGTICPPDDCTGGSCNDIDCNEHLFPKER
jgi:hypothetical protein